MEKGPAAFDPVTPLSPTIVFSVVDPVGCSGLFPWPLLTTCCQRRPARPPHRHRKMSWAPAYQVWRIARYASLADPNAPTDRLDRPVPLSSRLARVVIDPVCTVSFEACATTLNPRAML